MTEDVEVEIFGQSFRIAAGEATPAYIQKLANYVDERMRAIASYGQISATQPHGYSRCVEYR